MIVFAYYLLKVIICSGILFLYYHSALRNKLFHQWNRFYLLAAVLLSLIAPIIQISIEHHSAEDNNKAIQLLQAIQGNDYLDEIIISSHQSLSIQQWMMMMYAFISSVFFTGMIISFLKIFSIIQSHTAQWLQNIKFINTNLQGTPFSFFHFIFWNEKIDLQTQTGLQIFQHELVHVKEKHTIDKLLMQLILVLFWCNPFFWLVRRELKMIHEFIADKKAVGQHGTAALAAMILNSTYPSQFSSLTNQFFQTSIKRRLAMLTKIQNPKINYFSRILALPIIALTVLAFTLRTKNVSPSIKTNEGMDLKHQLVKNRQDTVPHLKGTVKNNQVSVVLNNEKKTVLTSGEIIFNSIKNLTSPNSIVILNSERVDISSLKGKKIVFKKLTIYDKNNEEAIQKYGSEAKNGVILFKDAVISDVAVEKNNSDQIPRLNDKLSASENVLYILNGKEISKAEMEKIDPNTIQSINILKGNSATELYGEKGKNGVIEIFTKSDNADENKTRQNSFTDERERSEKSFVNLLKDTLPGKEPLSKK